MTEMLLFLAIASLIVIAAVDLMFRTRFGRIPVGAAGGAGLCRRCPRRSCHTRGLMGC